MENTTTGLAGASIPLDLIELVSLFKKTQIIAYKSSSPSRNQNFGAFLLSLNFFNGATCSKLSIE